MAIRGIIGAFSKNISQDTISDEALMDWYDNIHIPDVIATSGQKTALRYASLNPNAEWRYLVVYPVNDILFSETEEFDNIRKGGHKELHYKDFAELAALDLRISERVSVFEPPGASKGRSKYLLAESISAPASKDEAINKWFENDFNPKLKSVKGLRRATRYVLYRSLVEGSPRHLVFYEFERSKIPEDDIIRCREEAMRSHDLGVDTKFEASGYQLAKEAGVLDESL